MGLDQYKVYDRETNELLGTFEASSASEAIDKLFEERDDGSDEAEAWCRRYDSRVNLKVL